jgi:hypothetical protein
MEQRHPALGHHLPWVVDRRSGGQMVDWIMKHLKFIGACLWAPFVCAGWALLLLTLMLAFCIRDKSGKRTQWDG